MNWLTNWLFSGIKDMRVDRPHNLSEVTILKHIVEMLYKTSYIFDSEEEIIKEVVIDSDKEVGISAWFNWRDDWEFFYIYFKNTWFRIKWIGHLYADDGTITESKGSIWRINWKLL